MLRFVYRLVTDFMFSRLSLGFDVVPDLLVVPLLIVPVLMVPVLMDCANQKGMNNVVNI